MTEHEVRNAFWFLNHSLVSKLHPSRPITHEVSPHERASVLCSICGEDMTYAIKKGVCFRCRKTAKNIDLSLERATLKYRSRENAKEYSELLKRCEKRGTCDVLAAHHELLAEDPERLTTKFLVSLVCNVDYTDGKHERGVLDIRHRGRGAMR